MWPSFVDSTETLQRTSLCRNLQRTLEWSHTLSIIWPSFQDFLMKPGKLENCDESPNNVTMKTLRWPTFRDCTLKSQWALLCDKSSDPFILISLENSSQSNYLVNCKMEAVNTDHIKDTRWLHFNVIWLSVIIYQSGWLPSGVRKWSPEIEKWLASHFDSR